MEVEGMGKMGQQTPLRYFAALAPSEDLTAKILFNVYRFLETQHKSQDIILFSYLV